MLLEQGASGVGTEGLPPGPTAPVPLINLRFWLRPEPFLRRCRHEYGDIFTVHVLPTGNVVFVATPQLARELFGAPTDLLHAGEGNAFMRPMLGEHSVFMLDEDEHLRVRRAMLPPFHGENVRRLVATMQDVAAAEVDRWPIGEPFELMPRFRDMML